MKKKIAVLSLMLFLLAILVFFAVGRAEPTVRRFIEGEFKREAASRFSEAVSSVIEEKGIAYDTLVGLDTDSEGSVTGLYTKVEQVSLLKSEVTLKLLSALRDGDGSILFPLGNLTGILLFTGRGPCMRVRLIGVKRVEGEIVSSFSSVGINQTRHTLDFRVKVEATYALLTGNVTFEFTDSIPIADTVIVGKVPDGYTSINKASDELIGDIVDFKAEP